MIKTIAFQTRARTIDHLGREQIADCPTAISELWKNSYDAYARNVALHLYDGELPVAALMDDGHGMNRQEFQDKWLVVGTDAKAGTNEVPIEDRNGLPRRPKQGQKGIGRLSSAALGPLCLVISKRRSDSFVAALIDWRVFENPFLLLQDIELPVVEFLRTDELFGHLPQLFECLMWNVWGGRQNAARDARIEAAWREFDNLERANGKSITTRQTIEQVVISAVFEERHIQQWPVWSGTSPNGTILLVTGLNFDLEAHFERNVSPEEMSSAKGARDRLFEILSGFADPLAVVDDTGETDGRKFFNYSVTVWEGGLCRPVISEVREFDRNFVYDLEHVIDGAIDAQGVFTGKVKAFGHWIECQPFSVLPAARTMRSDSRVGPFRITLGTYQGNSFDSSHPPDRHAHIAELAGRYGGFMVYRDGLRVMPYGREQYDFFEIEKRRSMNAGREFWSNRRIFGGVSITRDNNPNLKDKAGREGLIDNRAAKNFRDIVENLLKTTARKYFGTLAPFQDQYLPEIRATRSKEKAEENRKKQSVLRKKEFRANLLLFSPVAEECRKTVEMLAAELRQSLLTEENEIAAFRMRLRDVRDRFRSMSLGEPPRELGNLERSFAEYRQNYRRTNELLSELDNSLNLALEAVKPRQPREIAEVEMRSHAAFITTRLRQWYKQTRELLDAEHSRMDELYTMRRGEYERSRRPC